MDFCFLKKIHGQFSTECQKRKLMNKKAAVNKMYIPTDYEHLANTMSHAVMVIPSILASEFLLWKAKSMYSISKYDLRLNQTRHSFENDLSLPTYSAYEFCSRAYGTALISLFLVSTIYHWICWTQSGWKRNKCVGCSVRRPSLNRTFHFCDRTTIYFYIAGAYCPWMMLHEIHPNLLWLQWGIWIAAIAGTLYTFMFLEKNKLLETIFYLIVGIVPGAILYFFNNTNASATNSDPFLELAAGGSFYVIGVIFFKCDGVLPFAHAIWHCFVAAGASSHTYIIYKHLYTVV